MDIGGWSRSIDLGQYEPMFRAHANWLEKGQRERRWFALEEAAAPIEEPDLAALLRRLSEARNHIGQTRTITSAKVPA
jgi:hypothetical protein